MSDYKFTIDFWNEDHYKNFREVCLQLSLSSLGTKDSTVEVLEIGTFEGRTITKILDVVHNSNAVIVDPDPGPNFHHNLDRWFDSGRLSWLEKYSFDALTGFKGHVFDFIYIDGDHNANGVLEDAVLSWRILKKGGILLFDDYLMEIGDPWFYMMHKEFSEYKGLTFHHPKEAIDAFLAVYKGQYEVIIDNYQIGVKKICEIGKKNLNNGEDNADTFLKRSLYNVQHSGID